MNGQRSSEWAAKHVVQHPLQAFSPRYFSADSLSDGLISSRSDYAAALNQPQAQTAAFFSAPLNEAATDAVIEQENFLRFWRNPVRHWLQHTLSWHAPYADEAWTPPSLSTHHTAAASPKPTPKRGARTKISAKPPAA